MTDQFEHLALLGTDPLFAVMERYQRDPNPCKIDLGVGVYRDEDGSTPVLRAVRSAQAKLADLERSRTYLGPMGWPGFAEAACDLMLGPALAAAHRDRLAAAPAVGGWGALRLAGELVKRARPDARVWLSDPTWLNHDPLFAGCDLTRVVYPYYNADASRLERAAMFEHLGRAAAGDVVVLHGCCHNPTGEDLTAADWSELADIFSATGAVPLIDIAYHGFAEDLETDLAGARDLISQLGQAIVCYSFSKNMGVYRDRVGAVAVLCESASAARRVSSHLVDIARRLYFMPPSYGEALAHLILTDPSLFADWSNELADMRERLNGLRRLCADALADRLKTQAFSYLQAQRGMFSLLPFTEAQAERLRSRHSIHTALAGRINFCGLAEAAMPRFADALADVLQR